MKNNFIPAMTMMILVLFSCSTDDDSSPETDSVNTVDIDTRLLGQIKKANDIFDANQIWNGYELKNFSMYLIHKNGEGKADRAIIINPQSQIEGMTALPQEESAGLNAFRYDAEADRALNLLNADDGNGLYDFDFKIEGKGYYIQVYADEEVVAGENPTTLPGGFFNPDNFTLAAIDFIIHENFHTYQDSWSASKVSISEQSNPQKVTLTKEILELRILNHQIFKDFPNGNLDKAILEEKLKQYIAIKAKEIELGASIESSDLLTETDEGSARFVEKMAIREIFPKRANEPFIKGTILEDDYGVTKENLADIFGFALYYEIGASACYAISGIDKNFLEKLKEDQTIYQVAKDMYPLTTIELANSLQGAKDSVDWNAIQNKAQEFLDL